MIQAEVASHVFPDKGLVIALGEVGQGGVGLLVHTLQVEV